MLQGTAPTFAPERIGSGAVPPEGRPATQRELCREAARDLPPPLRQPCVVDTTVRSAPNCQSSVGSADAHRPNEVRRPGIYCQTSPPNASVCQEPKRQIVNLGALDASDGRGASRPRIHSAGSASRLGHRPRDAGAQRGWRAMSGTYGPVEAGGLQLPTERPPAHGHSRARPYFSFRGRAASTSFHPPQGSVQPRVM
jgi:hypothetical protein